ncbi:MAG: crossover junction endodeoxyribonuclease RuvC [Bacteroidales bacterium]|nr:crossover junction endodeoxyribonuclease RuvC [Bacteroidales bacterium]
MSKIKIEDIQEELYKDGWSLISTEYKNLDTEMIFECSEGHRVYSTWKKLRNRRECPVCQRNEFKDQKEVLVPKKKGEHRVLGLDQATRISGWSLFSDGKLLRYGTFETQLDDEIARDNTIKNWLISMINNWQPDFVALEGIQYQKQVGVTTFETLARLQGILLNCLYEEQIPYEICHTAAWRKYCGVSGRTRADKKRSMQMLIKEWYDVSVSNDCADAIGIGKYAVDNFNKQPEIISWE